MSNITINIKNKKQKTVNEVLNFINESESTIIVGYKFSTVKKLFELRKNLKNIKSSFLKICTNNVIKRAFKLKKISFDNDNIFSEMNGLVFLKDTMPGLKSLANFCKDSKIVIKTGIVNNKVCNYKHIMELALMPSKEESISKIIILLKRPLFNINYILKNLKNKKDNI